jgi:beta-galactosidase
LKAVGYIGGKPVAAAARFTPGKPAKLRLEAALEGLPLAADGADAVFVRATVCDAAGNLVPGATNLVVFIVNGKAQLVSPAAARAEAGVATVLIHSSGLAAGKVSLRASAPGLASARTELNAK